MQGRRRYCGGGGGPGSWGEAKGDTLKTTVHRGVEENQVTVWALVNMDGSVCTVAKLKSRRTKRRKGTGVQVAYTS